MLPILQFIFTDIWHFLGTLLLIGVTGDALVAVIRALRGSDVSPLLTSGLRRRGDRQA
jgi:hypothetical protein